MLLSGELSSNTPGICDGFGSYSVTHTNKPTLKSSKETGKIGTNAGDISQPNSLHSYLKHGGSLGNIDMEFYATVAWQRKDYRGGGTFCINKI